MDAINYYMIDRGCDAGLKERVREFFVASRTMQRRHRERRVVSLMSPALQGEVAMVAHSKVVSSVYYFKDASSDFTLGLSRVLHSRGYAQREMIWSTHLNIMHQVPTTTTTTTTTTRSSNPLTHSPIACTPSTRAWRRCAARSSYAAVYGTRISFWTIPRSDAPGPRAHSPSARCVSKCVRAYVLKHASR